MLPNKSLIDRNSAPAEIDLSQSVIVLLLTGFMKNGTGKSMNSGAEIRMTDKGNIYATGLAQIMKEYNRTHYKLN
jgi:hypothetical protein